jgi:hypothetical protein
MSKGPTLTPRKEAERAAAEARLAAALRDNLRRRKEQARGQDRRPEAPRETPAGLSPGVIYSKNGPGGRTEG